MLRQLAYSNIVAVGMSACWAVRTLWWVWSGVLQAKEGCPACARGETGWLNGRWAG